MSSPTRSRTRRSAGSASLMRRCPSSHISPSARQSHRPSMAPPFPRADGGDAQWPGCTYTYVALARLDHPELARVAHDRRLLMQRPLLRSSWRCWRCSELTGWSPARPGRAPKSARVRPSGRSSRPARPRRASRSRNLRSQPTLEMGRRCATALGGLSRSCDLDVRAVRAAAGVTCGRHPFCPSFAARRFLPAATALSAAATAIPRSAPPA